MSQAIHIPSRSQTAAAPPPHEHHHPEVAGIGRVPVGFFVAAVLFFSLGVSVLPFVVGDIAQYFYQPFPLAIVHTFTLGWITATIMGVMYRYVPALTRTPIRSLRLAWAQLGIFVVGASGMVTHFAIGIWFGLWLAAIVVFASILMFAWNILPCLKGQFGRGVAETGIFLSICFLIAAALLGMLLGMDKTYDFLGGSVLTNLSAHVHLAAVGWVTMAICAVSYRMLPAFVLPTIQLPASAKWQIYVMSAAVAGLVVSLLMQSSVAPVFAIAMALAIVWYVAIIARMIRTRRMPLDWTPLHAIAGVVSLAAAIALGIALSFAGGDSELGARLAPAYGAIGLLGFFSNFIIGMSYQLFPGIVGRTRTSAGWPPVTIAEISIPKPRLFVFAAFNIGVVVLAAGFLADAVDIARFGASLVAAGGIVYACITMWTLSFAFRPALLASIAESPLRVLPG